MTLLSDGRPVDSDDRPPVDVSEDVLDFDALEDVDSFEALEVDELEGELLELEELVPVEDDELVSDDGVLDVLLVLVEVSGLLSVELLEERVGYRYVAASSYDFARTIGPNHSVFEFEDSER